MSLLPWNHASRTGLAVAAAAMLMTFTGCTPAAPDETAIARMQADEEQVIRKLDAEWAKIGGQKNIDGWVSYYADDATVLPPNEPIAHDHAAIRRSVAGLLTLPELQISWTPTKVEVAKSGDLAYLTGAYTIKVKDEKGNPISDTGKILEVWKKQADGKWKCIVDMWNSDMPMHAPAPPSK